MPETPVTIQVPLTRDDIIALTTACAYMTIRARRMVEDPASETLDKRIEALSFIETAKHAATVQQRLQKLI